MFLRVGVSFGERCALKLIVQLGSGVVKDNVWTFSQFWQLYNSVTLFRLAGHEDCKEWQVGNGLTL